MSIETCSIFNIIGGRIVNVFNRIYYEYSL